LDGEVIQDQRISTDMLAFEPCAPHAGAHPLDDQAAFQLGDGTDDDHDGPAQRAASIDIFPEADVLDLETTELVQDFEEVFDTHLQALLGDRP
jgi:hypothetical protein